MYEKLRKICWEGNMKLPELGLVLYTFGNVSAVDRGHGVFAIKPSGVEYARLRPEDIVIVSLSDGSVVDGALRPSSDTNTHLELYRAFPEIGGIVHTHSTCATSWAQAARPVPIYGTTHADHLAVDIPCTDFLEENRVENDYETETGLQIIRHFESHNLDPTEIQMVLVAGHGPFTWGGTANAAVRNARILEELCTMALNTELLCPGAPRLKDYLVRKHYLRKHGKNATYGQGNSIN
ncbi:MAG: L-ribulose-5-phosphate 4-epimerase AraD [Victivallales bacterium]|nr:L-ribulose-5-phosphate 4-epimerase AraD [Victivallales bacterium]